MRSQGQDRQARHVRITHDAVSDPVLSKVIAIARARHVPFLSQVW